MKRTSSAEAHVSQTEGGRVGAAVFSPCGCSKSFFSAIKHGMSRHPSTFPTSLLTHRHLFSLTAIFQLPQAGRCIRPGGWDDQAMAFTPGVYGNSRQPPPKGLTHVRKPSERQLRVCDPRACIVGRRRLAIVGIPMVGGPKWGLPLRARSG